MKGYIYSIYNKLDTDRLYIGQTQYFPEHRFNEHCYSAGNDPKTKLHIAMSGRIEDFTWKIIEECDVEDLNEREKYWIKYHDSCYAGYNMNFGGSGNNSSVTQENAEYMLEL